MSIKPSEKTQNYTKSLKDLGASEELLEAFLERGLPTKKDEDYKYTSMEKVLSSELKLNDEKSQTKIDELLADLKDLPGDYQIVFVNGSLNSEETRLPEGLSLSEEKIERKGNDPFEGLVMGAQKKGYLLTVPAGKKTPLVNLVHLYDGSPSGTSLSKVKIEAERSSESAFLELVFSHENEKGQSFAVTDINCQDNARVHHSKAILSGLAHIHVGKVYAELSRDAHLYDLTFSAAGALNRNNIEVNINGEGAHATANGLFTARGEQHQDNFSHIHHKAAHTTSDQVFKGIMDDHGRGAFTGKIVIHRDAQQVDSSQLNKNLLLSKKAHVDTRPQIEVYADDVKCGHGATVGQINEEEVFYLESRGIPKAQAQKILCHAFGQEVIDSCPEKEVGEYLSRQLFNHFEKYALEKLGEEE